MAVKESALTQIDPNLLSRNPDNPRLIFRENEMNQLLESIKKEGILVPITVYKERKKYVLIDGERRWKCALKLNLRQMPAIIQPKPSKLQNLLTMFNIHNVRVEWDLLPMAFKLNEIKTILDKEAKPSKARDLSAITGVSISTVNRAFSLLDMPHKYQEMLMKEGEKPREEQKITADLFVEIFKSRRVVERYAPDVFKKVSRSQYVESLLNKYRRGVVKNVVHYREISKIARVERTGFEREEIEPIITRLIKEEDYAISQAYQDSVKAAYEFRDLTTKTQSLLDILSTYKSSRNIPNDLKAALIKLRHLINRLLGA